MFVSKVNKLILSAVIPDVINFHQKYIATLKSCRTQCQISKFMSTPCQGAPDEIPTAVSTNYLLYDGIV